ncbi:MAG: histidine--tRNA ligase [Flavobacteriales bacterium]|nr:MAG: histidine--tRNA ligase [Flavobacteriales bacterium]
MAINKPSIPKGTRDFSPDEMVRRNYLFDTIRSVFKKYGYQPIETPAMENIESLTGKYGDEGDQLLFKILNSRPYEAKDSDKQKMRDAFNRSLAQNTNNPDLTERALRYDLTVPFARYVVQHQNEITFPFKRYQIQPVWRADRPQKGRYREFFQCDADVIGSNSLNNEVEMVQMIDEVFTALKVSVTIKINNRKILAGIAEVIGEKDKIVDITVSIDKLDKIGVDGVNKELLEKQISETAIEKLQPLIIFKGNYDEKIKLLSEILSTSEIGMKGVEEIKTIFDTYNTLEKEFRNQNSRSTLELDITLARGLNYYTGAIFEVKANAGTFTSSITGGGRYDDLTGVFGLANMSGVGISFGADRICDVMDELKLYPESVTAGTRLLFINNGGKSEANSLLLLKQVREKNIAAEIYPDNVKWEKQAKYIDAKKILYTATVEDDGKITLKFQDQGKWNTLNVTFEELINKIV